MALSWNEIGKLITKMKTKDKDKPAIFQDGRTGEFVGFTCIVEDGDNTYLQNEPKFDFLIEHGSPVKFYPQSERATKFMEGSMSAKKSDDHYLVKSQHHDTYISDLTYEGMTWSKK